jgi:hypothetical protein
MERNAERSIGFAYPMTLGSRRRYAQNALHKIKFEVAGPLWLLSLHYDASGCQRQHDLGCMPTFAHDTPSHSVKALRHSRAMDTSVALVPTNGEAAAHGSLVRTPRSGIRPRGIP